MDPVEIPDYLMTKNIRQLIMLTGLDINNNPVHKNILASFQNKRADYRLLSSSYEPQTRRDTQPTRSSTGVLKHDWPLKYSCTSPNIETLPTRLNTASSHINVRPALIVLFVELDWNHPEWTQKRIECESKIASLRQNLNCRDTRVVLTLIQNQECLSHQDENQMKDRAAELCSSLQLTEKQLFVFPKHENYDNVALRLDELFYTYARFFAETVSIKNRMGAFGKIYWKILLGGLSEIAL